MAGEFAPEAKIIHIDVDPTSIRKNVRVDIPIVGDVKHVMVELNKELHHIKEPWEAIRKSWLKQIDAWREERPLTYEYLDDVIKPQFVVQKLYEITAGDAIVVTRCGPAPDVGRAVLQVRQAPELVHLRRPRDDGVWVPGCDRRQGCPS